MTICIYHAGCADGFGAAWAVRKALGDSVEYYPAVYQDAPPDVTGRDVVMVDFSYKRPVLDEMRKTARSIIILDHHKTAQEDLAGLPEPLSGTTYLAAGKCCAKFDQTHSGAVLSWEFFHPGEPVPLLLKHVEDRDLWKFELPSTREIQAAVYSYPQDFATWDELAQRCEDATGWKMLAAEGAAIERNHLKNVASLVKSAQRVMKIGGIELPVANIPYMMASDGGHALAMAHPSKIGVTYIDTKDGRTFSLRSTDDGPDVSTIAKQYGGGGHAHASGFRKEIGWEGEGRTPNDGEPK